MKFLENSKLEAMGAALSESAGDCRLDVRVESYSCKLVKSDKRVLSGLLGTGGSPNDRQPLSPPALPALVAPRWHQQRHVSGGSDKADDETPTPVSSINRKMLFNLTALLNASFPDYDFSEAKGEHFSQMPNLDTVVRTVESHLAPVSEAYAQLKETLWSLVDEEIQLKDCLFYSYNTDYDQDPFSDDGCIWSLNFFFYNLHLKRILFFTCRASSGVENGSAMMSSDEALWDMDEA